MEIKYLKLFAYADALNLMENLHSEVASTQNHKGFMLVLQHPPTVTMGKRELLEDMKVPPEELKYKGIAYHKIDRGGSVTIHEPGQIVIYPIININFYHHTVRSFVAALEQAMIETCMHYDICAARDEINPGVWVERNKIGAVGIRVKNKVTKHGLAFNVVNSLETFSFIIPCGLKERGVTNLTNLIRFPLNPCTRGEEQGVQKLNGNHITSHLCKPENLEIFYNEVEKYLAEKVKKLICQKQVS